VERVIWSFEHISSNVFITSFTELGQNRLVETFWRTICGLWAEQWLPRNSTRKTPVIDCNSLDNLQLGALVYYKLHEIPNTKYGPTTSSDRSLTCERNCWRLMRFKNISRYFFLLLTKQGNLIADTITILNEFYELLVSPRGERDLEAVNRQWKLHRWIPV
jgi:hypothetical protein